jgi:hypothetical protein
VLLLDDLVVIAGLSLAAIINALLEMRAIIQTAYRSTSARSGTISNTRSTPPAGAARRSGTP